MIVGLEISDGSENTLFSETKGMQAGRGSKAAVVDVNHGNDDEGTQVQS